MLLMGQYSIVHFSVWREGRFHCGCSEGPCWIYKGCKFQHAILIDISTPRGSAEEVVSSLIVYWLYIQHNTTLFFLSISSSLPHQAISGQAVDRHLSGLKLIAAEVGMETPSLFKDVAYTRSVSHILFSSNVCIGINRLLKNSHTWSQR